MSLSQIMTMMLAGFVLVLVQSTTAQAQWTTGTNINNTNSGTVSVGTTSPGGDKLIVAGNTVGGNITSHTQLYSGFDSQANVVMELGYGTATANITPYPTIVLSKNLTSTSNFLGAFQFANRSIADGSEKRIAQIAGWTDGATNSGALSFHTSSAGTINERVRISSAGNVGIGTTSPLQKLQIGSNTITGTATPNAISLGATYSSTAGANPKLRLFDDNAGSVYGLGVSAGEFDFMVPTGARYSWSINGAEKMRLDSTGNVGIGTVAPTKKLDVAGDINASGTITGGNIVAKYQDVAEWVQSSQELTAGTVVVLDQTKSNQVIASSQAYDTRVAGVISAQPGITLGENGAGKVLVATTGRVRIKVDASRGSIQVGDLLVTSSAPGFAMKSQPIDVGGVQLHRPGTLIGKALEPLEKGTGEILVLLSLQ